MPIPRGVLRKKTEIRFSGGAYTFTPIINHSFWPLILIKAKILGFCFCKNNVPSIVFQESDILMKNSLERFSFSKKIRFLGSIWGREHNSGNWDFEEILGDENYHLTKFLKKGVIDIGFYNEPQQKTIDILTKYGFCHITKILLAPTGKQWSKPDSESYWTVWYTWVSND